MRYCFAFLLLFALAGCDSSGSEFVIGGTYAGSVDTPGFEAEFSLTIEGMAEDGDDFDFSFSRIQGGSDVTATGEGFYEHPNVVLEFGASGSASNLVGRASADGGSITIQDATVGVTVVLEQQ